MAKVGSIEFSGNEMVVSVGGRSCKGEVRASKKELSSSTGVNMGKAAAKLDVVLVGAFVKGSPVEDAGAMVARSSRSAVA